MSIVGRESNEEMDTILMSLKIVIENNTQIFKLE